MNTRPLLVCIPYCVKDADQTRRLLHWIARISPALAPHCCLMAADSAVPHEIKVELGNLAKGIFQFAETAILALDAGDTGWPKAPNAMFRIASLHIQECFQLGWLWLEPDAVPLRPSWLDELALTYYRCPKRFMGSHIHSSQPPLPPVHLAGCAVYPPDAAKLLAEFCAPAATQAWDIASASYVIPRSFDTPLIHHHYGTMELAPTFKAEKLNGDPINTCTLDFIRKDAAIFHRCKDATLIDLLTQKVQSASSAAPKAEKRNPAKRGQAEKPAETPVPA